MLSRFDNKHRFGVLARTLQHGHMKLFISWERELWPVGSREVGLPACVAQVCQQKRCEYVGYSVQVEAVHFSHGSRAGEL